MSKKEVGKVLNLYISKSSRKKIFLNENGVVQDKFYGKNKNRSVLLATHESYLLAKKNNILIDNGSLGENILINYNPYSLPIGTKVKIGDVLLEITQHCTICNSLSKIDTSLPLLLKNDRGIFAKVIISGYIKVNDKISIGEN